MQLKTNRRIVPLYDYRKLALRVVVVVLLSSCPNQIRLGRCNTRSLYCSISVQMITTLYHHSSRPLHIKISFIGIDNSQLSTCSDFFVDHLITHICITSLEKCKAKPKQFHINQQSVSLSNFDKQTFSFFFKMADMAWL